MSRPRRHPDKARNTAKTRDADKARPRGKARKAGKARNTAKARAAGKARTPVDTFWEDTDDQSRTAEKIQPTTDPAALPRSLGQPPLTPDTAAQHHLAAVYEEAVRTATALAAANGLLQHDEPK